MTAQGKMNAANLAKLVATGTPVRVLLIMESAEKLAAAGVSRVPGLVPANRKTGVDTLALLEVETRTTTSNGWSRRATRDYRFRTSVGWTLWVSPIQTFILAPEDVPAVKRAHAEAREENARRAAVLEEEYRAAGITPEALENATGTKVIQARQVERVEFTPVQEVTVTAGEIPAGWEYRGSAGLVPADTPDLGEQLARERRSARRPYLTLAPTADLQEDGMILQVLRLLDDGVPVRRSGNHAAPWVVDAPGAALLLEPARLNWTVHQALALGLVRQYNPTATDNPGTPILRSAAVHLALHGSGPGARVRPRCMRPATVRRFRVSDDLAQVTCDVCQAMVQQDRERAAAQARWMAARGIAVDAVVTIHRGAQEYTVVRIEEDMVQVTPNLTEEDREAIEASGGVIRDLRWVSGDMVQAVQPVEVGRGENGSHWR